MDKFEYIWYNLDNNKYGKLGIPSYKQDINTATLDELGEKGWEMILPLANSSGGTKECILKRKIEDNTSPSAEVTIKNIGDEDAARALTRAAYTGAMMALDQFMEKQRQQQNPSRQSTDYEYSR